MTTVFYGNLDFVIDADVFEKEQVALRLFEAFYIPDPRIPKILTSRPEGKTVLDAVLDGGLDTAELSIFVDADNRNGSNPEPEAYTQQYGTGKLPSGAIMVHAGFAFHEASFSTVESVSSYLNGPLFELAYPGYPIVMRAETDEGPGELGLFPRVDVSALETLGAKDIPEEQKYEQQRLSRFAFRKMMEAWDSINEQLYTSKEGMPCCVSDPQLWAIFLAATNEVGRVRRDAYAKFVQKVAQKVADSSEG